MQYHVVATALAAALWASDGNAAPCDASMASAAADDSTAWPGTGPIPGSRVGPTKPGPDGSRWTQRFERDVNRSFYLAPYVPPSEANRYH